jgi:hypothetical protein
VFSAEKFNWLHISPYRCSNGLELGHQASKVRGGKRLKAVHKSLLGVGVGFDEETVGTGSYGRFGQRRYQRIMSGGMAGVDN